MTDIVGPPFRCVLAAWTAHEQELHAFLKGRVRDESVADDLLQEVFLKAIRAGAGFCGLDEPRAWLFQVTRNAMIDRHRLQKPTVPLAETLPAPATVIEPVDELSQCLDRALAALNADDRDVLQQCDLEGQTQRAYADIHELTVPAVKARIQRARVRLRQQLIDQCGVRFADDGRVCCHDHGRRQPT